MYSLSARIYDALYSFKDYADEARRLHELIQERRPGARTLLDVACGTGKHLAELRAWYDVEGVDIEPQLLAFARERLQGVPLHEGDMTDFDLGRSFDVVTCLFSSIGYAYPEARMRAAVAAMARHLAPGGLLVVEPWLTPDRFREGHVGTLLVEHEGVHVARMNVVVREGELTWMDLHHLVGTADGVEHFVERHELGFYVDEQYRDALVAAGLDTEHEEEGLIGRGLWLGLRR